MDLLPSKIVATRPGPLGLLASLAFLGAGLAPWSVTGAGTALAAGRVSPSRYPAGAQRPSIVLPRSWRTRTSRRRTERGSAPGAAARAAASRRRRTRHPRPGPVLHGNSARAFVAFQAMQARYYIAGSGLYAGEPFSYLWPFSQAFAATVSVAGIPALSHQMNRELHTRLTGLRSYLDLDNSGAPEGTYTSSLPAYDGTVAPPAGPGGGKYYDDNDWVGIELVRLYHLDHSPAILGAAEGIMAFEMAGWQASPELACPGGIPFSNEVENTDRNTVTTAPAAELAAQLYLASGNAEYLRFAEMAYLWVRRCLLRSDGLYADHLNRQGQVDESLWSYVQGTMIGAGALLFKATGNRGYLDQARQTAAAAAARFTPERLGAEIPFFPSVYLHNLLYLDSITHEPYARRIAQSYVDYAWQNLRLSGNVFVAGSPPSGQLLVQAAIVQIYALLASPPSSYF